MSKSYSKRVTLSLITDFSDDDENEEYKEAVVLQIGDIAVKLKYSQLFKYSQLIRDEYVFSDAQNILPQQLLQFQRENQITNSNLISFVKLFDDEDIEISNQKYKDFLRLSEFFKIKKLINQLKKYFKEHCQDVDFVIRLFVDEIEHLNQTEQINDLFTYQMKELFSEKMDECLRNPLFNQVPISIIYEIIESLDNKEINCNLLFEFIIGSVDKLYVLFNFIKLENLSDENFNKLYEILLDVKKKHYEQYLPVNLNYIMHLRNYNKKLQTENMKLETIQDSIKNSNIHLQNKLDQAEEESKNYLKTIEKMEQKINVLKEENTDIQNKFNQIEKGNKLFQERNEELIQQMNILEMKQNQNEKEYLNSKESFQDQIEKLKQKINKLKNKKNDLKIKTKNYPHNIIQLNKMKYKLMKKNHN